MSTEADDASAQRDRSTRGARSDPDRAPRRRLAWTLSVLASVLLIGGLAAIKFVQVRAAIAYGESFPVPAVAVIGAAAVLGPISATATAIGELQAKNIVELRIERSGVVRAVRFESGDELPAGAVLVEIDVAEERADLAAAEVEASRAEREARRQRRLESEGVGTESRLQEAEAVAAAARARVAALETAIDRKTIRAPFAGRVGISDLKAGQYVSEGALVTRLVGLDDEIWVDFALPQAAALGFDPQSPVRVVVDGETIEARVVAREPAIDTASRSLAYRAVMARSGRNLPAGSLVTVNVPIGEPREQVVIPRTALVRSPYGDTVYVLEEKDGQTRARAVIVEVGNVTDTDEIAIRSGLEPGLRIAADGVFKLRDGALVDPQEPRASGRTSETASTKRAER